MNPLISVLIPTYNRADYLGEALDSALAQDYPNLEVIVHDDASTDNTPQLLKSYHDPRLRVIRTRTNHGMLGGWNYIVKQAHGEYLKFLASDDLLSPNCVSELVAAALANPGASLVTCRRRFINERGKTLKTVGFAGRDKTVAGPEHAHWVLTTLRENKIGEPSAVLYPRAIVKKSGQYDPTFSQFADFEYWIRLLEFGPLVYINQSLCSFRQHEGSSTTASQRDGRFVTEIFTLLHKYYDSPNYTEVFGLSQEDRVRVTRQKTLDTMKNIKDLFVSGQLSRARAYYRRLKREVTLDYMTRMTISHLLKT